MECYDKKYTYLDNGCDKLLQKFVFEQVGPVMVDEVDEETFDVGPILVLICHDHQPSVPQGT